MDPEKVEKINSQIWTQFPYLNKVNPILQSMPDNSIILKYSGESKTASGHTIPITVKVKANQDGKILNIISTR